MLIDTRVVDAPIELVDRNGPGTRVEVYCRRIVIASEDREVDWCRMYAVAQGADWPPRMDGLGDSSDGSGVEMTLGLGADQLPLLDGPRDVADVARQLLAGDLPELATVSNWYLLVATPPGGEPAATAWASQPLLGTGPPPPPVSPLVSRILAVMFEQGWEPRRSADKPSEIVATVEPEDGWILSGTAVEETGEVLIALTLPENGDLAPGATGPGGSELATVERDEEGTLRVCARVRTVDGSLASEVVAGMIDSVIDAAREWSSIS
jgi:hypothetical protein